MHPGLQNFETFLGKYSNFVIATHESPDADGLGAEIAFLELLKKLGKTTFILNGDPLPYKYRFMDIDNEINLAGHYPLPDNIADYALFVLDTNPFSNTGATYSILKDVVKEVFIIDHHEGGHGDVFKSNFVEVTASSASEIIYQIYMNFFDEMSFKAAQALYTGILFDTGGFRYSKTSSITFLAISNLVKFGANPTKLYELIYENNQLETMLLRAKMLATMEIHFSGKLLLMYLTPKMLIETGATFAEGELNINIPLTIHGVVASVIIKQDINGPVKVSMRTKGDYDVSGIALSRGGGGHKNAAGYKTNLPFDEIRAVVLNDMEKFFP